MEVKSSTVEELVQYGSLAATIVGVTYTLYWGYLYLTTPVTSVIRYVGCAGPNHGFYCDLQVHGVSVTYIILSVFFLGLGNSYVTVVSFYNTSKRLRSFLKNRKTRKENQHIEDFL